MKRITLITLVSLLVTAGLGLFGWQEAKVHYSQLVTDDVRDLGSRRPAKLTKEQWEVLIFWTNNDVGNCLPYAGMLDTRQFAQELHRRCAGPVDVHTIDWIWDEIARIVPRRGSYYSEQYRPTLPEHLKALGVDPLPKD